MLEQNLLVTKMQLEKSSLMAELSRIKSQNEKDVVTTLTKLQAKDKEISNLKSLNEAYVSKLAELLKKEQEQEKVISNLESLNETHVSTLAELQKEKVQMTEKAQEQEKERSVLEAKLLTEKQQEFAAMKEQISVLLAENNRLTSQYPSSPEIMYEDPPESSFDAPNSPTETSLRPESKYFEFLYVTGRPYAAQLVMGGKFAEGSNQRWELLAKGGWIHICTTTNDPYKPGHVIGATQYAYTLETEVAKRWFPTQFSCGFLVDKYKYQHFMSSTMCYTEEDCIHVPGGIRNTGPIKLSNQLELRTQLERRCLEYFVSERRKLNPTVTNVSKHMDMLSSRQLR
jgi:hypothetical protein